MTNKLTMLNTALSTDGLAKYCCQANNIPMLTAEEERELSVKFYENNDLSAARQLVLAHLRFVVKVARGYAGYGLMQADLIQEGNVGLMKAVKRFNPNVGVRLVTFAVHWIKAEMHEFIIRNWRIVKVATTKAQRKLFFNLRSMKSRLGWFNQEEVAHVAEALGVTPKDVVEMENRLNAHDSAFDLNQSDGDDSWVPAEFLEDASADPAEMTEAADSTAQSCEGLQAGLANLDARSCDIVKRRWLSDKKATLHELAAQYKVSAERIRQIETNAMKKLREHLVLEA